MVAKRFRSGSSRDGEVSRCTLRRTFLRQADGVADELIDLRDDVLHEIESVLQHAPDQVGDAGAPAPRLVLERGSRSRGTRVWISRSLRAARGGTLVVGLGSSSICDDIVLQLDPNGARARRCARTLITY